MNERLIQIKKDSFIKVFSGLDFLKLSSYQLFPYKTLFKLKKKISKYNKCAINMITLNILEHSIVFINL
jgi:hypothetical protein